MSNVKEWLMEEIMGMIDMAEVTEIGEGIYKLKWDIDDSKALIITCEQFENVRTMKFSVEGESTKDLSSKQIKTLLVITGIISAVSILLLILFYPV